MLPQGNHLFGSARSIPSQGSVPASLALASDSSSCFQCQVGSSLVLHRPIEIARLTGTYAACAELSEQEKPAGSFKRQAQGFVR
jgi:hypothetical protein